MRLGSSIRRRRKGGRSGSIWNRVVPKWIREDKDGKSRWTFLKDPWTLGLLAALSVAGFAGGYLISTRVVYPPPPPPGDLFPVPDLTGQSPEAAADTLATLGLVLGAVDSMAHPGAPMGQIIGQSPLPGQLSLPGGSVRLALSTGPERRPVPDVLRLDGDRARVVLETSGFVVTVDSVESSDPRGRVMAMVPEPGAEAVIPAEVRLRVSMGPPEFEMPLVLDLPEAEARAILESRGLVVGDVETRFRFGRDQGMVVEQEPAASTMVQEGTIVRLVVGRRGE
jgi:beta-lactam-binding protein with PASTA domain